MIDWIGDHPLISALIFLTLFAGAIQALQTHKEFRRD